MRPGQPPPARPPARPGSAAPSEFADEATEVYGEDGAPDAHQVKGRLAVLEGELAGHWFTLLGAEIRIGRSDDNHLIIPDLAVSRHHVRLIHSHGAYRLQDLRSGNGSYVNGIHVEEASLRDGDQIEVGRTIMEFLTRDRAPGPVRFRRSQAPGGPSTQPFQTAAPPPRQLMPPAGPPAPAPPRPMPPPPRATPIPGQAGG
ncbi:MAG: FHA domain-containing protein, partial [Candidatus Bipolaricaulota bacterium]